MKPPAQPCTVELFMADGHRDGLVVASMFNWTGRITMAPAAMAPRLDKTANAHQTGAYLLLGKEGGEKVVDIDAGYDMIANVTHELARVDLCFVKRIVLITDTDGLLTISQSKWLVDQIYGEGAGAGGDHTILGEIPPHIELPESQKADMEMFLQHVRTVLPALGVRIVSSPVGDSSRIDTPDA